MQDSDWGASGRNPFEGKKDEKQAVMEELMGKKQKKLKIEGELFPTLPGQPATAEERPKTVQQ